MRELGPYYLNFNKSIGEDFSEYQFSEQGIPLVRFGLAPDWHHNPVTVAQYALSQFNDYLANGNLHAKEKFLIQANWLLMNYEAGPRGSAVWYYRLNIPFYRLKKPWISGMAQGEALSVLLRAYQVSKNAQYLDVANKAWKIFTIDVNAGGVLSTFPDGSIAIEEYPSKPTSNVLNGYMFALFGIYDYMKIHDKEDVVNFFNESILSLKKNLMRYDTTYWSLYDLMKPSRLTSHAYHRLHIELLKSMYHITHIGIFEKTATRWEGYLRNPLCNVQWLIYKLRQRAIRVKNY